MILIGPLTLDQAAEVNAALHRHRRALVWAKSASHATEEEKQDATERLALVDAVLERPTAEASWSGA